MCGLVDHYLRVFSQLKIAENSDGSSESTNLRSPCKPLLLLSVLDLIALGSLNRNFIEPSDELSERFRGYLLLMPAICIRPPMAYPFVSLQSDGFWWLRPRAESEPGDGQPISSVERLRECYFGATVDDNLYPLLQMQTSREKLRDVLVESYFVPELQPRLREHSVLKRSS